MNSLIKYGLYFAVAFSVLAFGAAEDGKTEVGGRRPEIRRQRSEVRVIIDRIVRRLRRFIKLATDTHQTPLCELRTAGRLTQTFVRRTPVPSPGATGQASPDKNSHRFAKRQETEEQEIEAESSKLKAES